MSTKSFADPIGESLFPKARRTLLALLYGQPERTFYLREIVATTGLGVGHVQREVQRLARAGILRRTSRGRQVHFQADPSCPVHAELHRLVTKTTGATGTLRAALAPLSTRVRAAFIFGSVARSEDREGSDLDLMVIGDVSFAEVVEAIRGAEPRVGREIHPTVYPPGELREKLAADHHFLRSVLEGEKLFVAGSEDELRRVREE